MEKYHLYPHLSHSQHRATLEIGHPTQHSLIHPLHLHPHLLTREEEDRLGMTMDGLMTTMMILGSQEARIILVHPGVVHTRQASLVNGRAVPIVAVDGEAIPEIGRRHPTLPILSLHHLLHHLNSPVPVHLMHQRLILMLIIL